VIKRARGTIRRVAPIVGEAMPVGSQASLHLLHERSLRPRKRGQIRTLLEICCGTASVADELLRQNPTAEIYTLDIDPQFDASFIADVVNWLYTDYFSPGYFDMYWCSPPCRRYTVTLGRPVELRDLTEADAVARACIRVKDVGKPRTRFVENPVGLLRTRPFMLDLESFRKEYSNCHYGKPCRKVSHLWTNVPIHLRSCRWYDMCEFRRLHGRHERTAQQGPTGQHHTPGMPAIDAAAIPTLLARECIRAAARYLDTCFEA
jgi:hypothetical protein